MSDREKLLKMMKENDIDFEEIVCEYISSNYDAFSSLRIHNLITKLNTEHLYPRIINLEHGKVIAKERALYLKSYLEGNMYTTKESALDHVPVQLMNVQAIIDSCK